MGTTLNTYATPLAGTKTPEQFLPADADFCLITFTLLPSPFLNGMSLKQRNAAAWTYDEIGAYGATTFVAPRLDRPRSWYNALGSERLDVTENIYIGARPGHNQQAEELPSHTCTCTCTLVIVQLPIVLSRWFGSGPNHPISYTAKHS